MAEFNQKEFIVTNIVNGIKKGAFAREYGNIMAVKFVAKGFITFDEVAIIDAEINAWEEAQHIEPPVVEDETLAESEDSAEITDETTVDEEVTTEETEAPTEPNDETTDTTSTNEDVVEETE